MKKRIVITGMGVVSPNGVGLESFSKSLQKGTSGIRFFQELEDLKFSCCIAGQPELSDEKIAQYFSPLQLRGFDSSGIMYGVIAGKDAWLDAGLSVSEDSEVDYDSGTIFGVGTSGIDKFRESIYKIDDHKVKRLGSTAVIQTMSSGISAYLGGILGLGNQVTTNSSACSTGTEALIMGYDRLMAGRANRMLVGSCSDSGPYIWGGFDALRVMTYKHNDSPTSGSRPMSATASGFVPGSGGGALVIETLESALERDAQIYAEIIGTSINSGGQRNGGSMTAPNSEAVQKCIKDAVAVANINPLEIDLINGHLTATAMDSTEIKNWSEALGLKGVDFPYINALKSQFGHCLAAAGAIETVATILQIKENFIAPSINCEDMHPDILRVISSECIPHHVIFQEVNTAVKASFGFGDVNTCVIFKSYQP